MGTPQTSAPVVAGDELADLRALEPEVVETVRRWLSVAASIPADTAATRLAGVLEDENGLAFTVGFIDRVIRPEDPHVAARSFAELAGQTPRFLPWPLRVAVRLGAAAGLVAPRLVIPVVRAVLRRMVSHLVIDARPRPLTRAIRHLRSRGAVLNLNLLGEAVLGEREAVLRLAGTRALLERDDVDYVSIKVSSTVAPHSAWAFDEAVEHIVNSLEPLYRVAAAARPQKFLNLDMEEYRDLELTVAVFTRMLDRAEFRDLRAGIVLQAYLPDALATLIRLQDWAALRVEAGGAPIKVRIVKGANLPMERVEAQVHGWPLATWHSKQESDTNYKRLLDYALHPQRIANVGIGVAGHNLFDVAFAWLLAQHRDVVDGVEFEMLLGMAQGQAEAVRRDVGSLLLYTPVVHPRQFDVAIAYLVRRLEEGASHENFMSAVFALNDDTALFVREQGRFSDALRALDRDVPAPHRSQDRSAPVIGTPDVGQNTVGQNTVGQNTVGQNTVGFRNAADTDPSIRANERWGREILARVPTSTLGEQSVAQALVSSPEVLDDLLARTSDAGGAWGSRPGRERAVVLRAAAVELERCRGDLIEVMGAECGKTIHQADPEVSEAIDFAAYYATLAGGLDEIDGARAVPVALTVVTPPWNFPVAIAAGSSLAALAAGSAVVLKPAPQARRCAAVLVDALHAGGVPRDVLRLVDVDEATLGRELVADPRVQRLVLTGGYETAELFRSFRPDLPLLAETSGKNAIVVTPSADLDLAVKDVVHSAFGHAGQKCSAASLVILVGSVASSARFRNQLRDAVRSLAVGLPQDPASVMGPLIEPASGKLLDALTVLGPGERWLVQPRRLDDDGRLWTPGVKEGVVAGSAFHLTEYFGPVLGIMTADTLAEAIDVQNAVPYGLTAGLFSLDDREFATWVDGVQAGNLYVNRSITGAVVRRQPFGGWKRSAVGAGTKAGGPNYLVGLADWVPAEASHGGEIDPRVRRVLDAARSAGIDGGDSLPRALASDALAWRDEFGAVRDVSGLSIEHNVLRYRTHPVLVRHAAGALRDLVRVAAAGVLSRAAVTVSTPAPLPDEVVTALRGNDVEVVVEDDEAWRARLAALDGGRVRLVGGRARDVYDVVGGRPDVAVYAQPVTESGRIEVLPFVREQAISVTRHRFGSPDDRFDHVLGTTHRA